MYLEQGKKYECIKKSAYEFIVGEEYVALTHHTLLNQFAIPFDVGDWDNTTFEKYFKLVECKESVKHPKHYNQDGIECLDVIKAFYGTGAFEDFCLANALKYVMRCKLKENYVDDIKKARFYLDEIIKLYDKEN